MAENNFVNNLLIFALFWYAIIFVLLILQFANYFNILI